MKNTKAGQTPAPSAERPLWVYGYQMNPPHQEERMSALRNLLDQESIEAARQGRKWTACVVTEERVSHVLVVTSSPDVDLEINRRLESQLTAMGIRFEISVPMPV